MAVGLTLGVTAAVVGACTAAAYVYSQHHLKSLLDSARTSALAEGELIRTALEHQMLDNDGSLIAEMIERFGKQARVEQLVLLDRNGVARYSSKPLTQDNDFQIGSPTCQACHRDPPERRASSRIIDTKGGTVLLCTGHHERTFPRKEYSTDNSGVNVAATEWLARQGIVHFGIDSMRPGTDSDENLLVHKACLELGITHIDRFASMSDMKLDALRDAGITVGESVALPDGLIPADARVEIEAKLAAGYRGGAAIHLDAPSIGRALDE